MDLITPVSQVIAAVASILGVGMFVVLFAIAMARISLDFYR